ncbi:YIP1 family protein [bacterium]|nr:YIP1 family protein [bacterium]
MESNQTEPVAEMNVFSRVINLFVTPSKTLEALIAKPDWVTPLVLIFLMFIATSILLKEVIQAEQAVATKESIMKNAQIPDNQKEQYVEQSVTMMKKFWAVGIGVGFIVVLALYLLGGLVLHLAGKNILKGEGTYLQVLSIFGYSGLVDILAGIIKVPLMMANQTMRVDTGLGMLVATDQTRTPLYVLLSKFDLFTFWQLAILIIGLSMLYKFSKEKSAALVIGLWLIWVLLSVGFTALGTSMGG